MCIVKAILCSLLVFGLVSCGQSQENATATPVALPAPAPVSSQQPVADIAAIQAALRHADRLAGDAREDEWRKSAEVLAFLGVGPGMHVIDYFAGGGYYSELLSRIVGPQGRVIAYNNAPYVKYAAEKPAQRYAANRLANVVQLTAPPETVPLDPSSLDAALFVQSYHDLHWISKDGSWPKTDPVKALAQLVPALKPGAIVVVVDHVASTGSDPAVSVDTLHRIDPAIIKRDFEAAGLVFETASDVFKNTADDHSKVVFDPAVSHKTDQVMYRFVKAGAE